MAITIQELLASDTISQVVDKINFNFDQLLLNGGGPVGPNGPAGPSGPIGGRGERGTEWYEGTDDPNVTPPTTTPLTADYYLQSNGDVWEYTGLAWTNTGINLTGPQGAAGTSAGWSFFGNDGSGNYFATAKNVSYPSLIPSGSQTINVNNEGVSSVVFGAAGPNDTGYPGIPLTNAFQLSTTMAGSLDASTTSALIHQKDSSATALRFMGGGAIPGDEFEQDIITNLSSIKLGIDDALVIDVPKAITGTIGSISDTYGFNVFTTNKGQNYRAGRGIDFTTGTLGSTLSGPFDFSDFNILLNPVNTTLPPKFNLQIVGADNASFEIGGNISFPSTTPSAGGRILLDGSSVRFRASSTMRFNSANVDYQFVNLSTASGTPAGLVGYTSTGSLTSLSAGGAFPTGQLSWNGSALQGNIGTDRRATFWNGTTQLGTAAWEFDSSGNFSPTAAFGQNIGVDSSNGRIRNMFFTGEYGGTNRSGIIFGGDSQNDEFGWRTVLSDRADIRIIRNGDGSNKLTLQLSQDTGATSGTVSSDIVNASLTLGRRSVFQFVGSQLQNSQSKIVFLGNNVNSGSSGGALDADQMYGSLPHGIYMNTGIPGNNLEDNIIKIKGSDGTGTSSSEREGHAVHIVGGDSSPASSIASSGSVVIAAGGRQLNQIPSQDNEAGIWIGYNHSFNAGAITSDPEEQALMRSAQMIRIGPTGSFDQTGVNQWSNRNMDRNGAWMTIQQPPGQMFNGVTDSSIAVQIRNNRTSPGSVGGFAVADYEDQNAINFQANLSSSAYWNRTVEGDQLIYATNNGNTGTGSGGLGICIKDRNNLGIRLDPSGGSENAQQIFFWGNRNEDADNLENLAFRFDGRQTLDPYNSQKTTDKYSDVISSGVNYPTSTTNNLAATGSGAGVLMWIRIGRIVQVTGIVNLNSSAGQRKIRVPLKGNGGIDDVEGTFVGYSGTNVAGEIHQTADNTFSPKYNGAWWGNSGNIGPVRVNFSYRLM